jgi:hypothetical protein
MKHLLIILISFLLLSSPLFSSEKEYGYVGDIEDGLPHGQGTVTYHSGNKYSGEWKDGVPVGKGTFTYPDGTKYVGGLKKGKRWNGIEYFKNGNIIGKYVNGVFKVVSQVEKRQKGVFYVGVLFNRSLVSGGMDWVEDGDDKKDLKYVGEIKNGLPNGQGRLTHHNLNQWLGEFKDGELNGQGTYTRFGDRYKYVGEWKDGSPNGQGIETNPLIGYKEKRKYVGEWKNGKHHGQGTFTAPDRPNYEGEWKDGFPNGQGIFIYLEGSKYIGGVKDGKWDGQGTINMSDGRKVIGEFRDKKPWNVIEYDKNKNIILKFINGEKIKQ